MNYNGNGKPGLHIQHPVPDLTKAFLDELTKIPTGTLQNLVEILPRRVEAVTAAVGARLLEKLV